MKIEYAQPRPEQIEDLFEMMFAEAPEYLADSLRLLGLTRREFQELFTSRGRLWVVTASGATAGFYWIELRGGVLHLHALILGRPFQGMGLGTRILRQIEIDHAPAAEAIELGVHDSNPHAKALYERCGYAEVRRLPEVGFTLLRKRLSPPPSTDRGQANSCSRF